MFTCIDSKFRTHICYASIYSIRSQITTSRKITDNYCLSVFIWNTSDALRFAAVTELLYLSTVLAGGRFMERRTRRLRRSISHLLAHFQWRVQEKRSSVRPFGKPRQIAGGLRSQVVVYKMYYNAFLSLWRLDRCSRCSRDSSYCVVYIYILVYTIHIVILVNESGVSLV